MSAFTFAHGIPTEPDVATLMEAFKVPSVGTVIQHGAIETLIKQDRKTCRYKSVTTAWRRKLYKDHNVIMGSIPSVGFKSLEPDERADFIGAKYKTGIRHVKRSQSVAIRTDLAGMTPESRRTVNHVKSTAAALVLADATAAKALPPIQ